MGVESYLPCRLQPVTSLERSVLQRDHYDTICVIDGSGADLARASPSLASLFAEQRSFDAGFESEPSCFRCSDLDCRVVYSPVGELTDFDDVRRFAEAAQAAVGRAIKAGAKQPLLVLPNSVGRFGDAALVSLLGALHKLYVPLQLREDVPEKSHRFRSLGVYHPDAGQVKGLLRTVETLENGRFVARDIGGGDPERMAPPRVAEYVLQAFANGPIKATVIEDPHVFEREYPLFQAVNRAAATVKRHQGRIIFLEYKPPNTARKTVVLVGKGVTYDTGGADIKAGGVMAGMSRDKCGAAAVAGFMKVVEQQQPADVHVIGVLCMVRNSVGEECYVSDEMITSRAGVRIRVGNTDAEGRMAMADALCQMKERVVNERLPDPHLFTIATLTGHAVLAVGSNAIVMDNGPAREAGHGLRLQQEAEKIGDPFEVSILRKEDFDFHKGKCYGEDVLQANNLPSSRTPRGHQGPAAFLMMATGLDKCGLKSAYPIKYSHLDIAGSAGDVPDTPTGSPILALARTHLQ
ncbi:putative aminopeptidase W07G4.4 [Anopheles albimanus]|uniref:Cytosol aminopeptidase domain-containing protein n=1 Tax=Anopheles albimanus TaxID=7167 RepID=A0A182F8I5_ANOAL|nr:putative aminopeptidase W07G4.4 [Anopheles albimanus]XP_035795113.1 putative aminopeptidase W07G4.4 [Anopheles albimanus]XP_035795114.1 putative aminopeptidase W07G4.4 [Anopheles albimanus]XP_035795115.1 putative aminopeptidase W07G4.4 [Anopheles albimanus]XP_035795116.1 putative aminopeptidase W07G4.4 [Anopheles albimanus]